jgi:lysophospholipase L1-like esterase
MATKPVIHLLGDGILDNFSRLPNPNQDLRKELIDLGFDVNNCAIDDVRVVDIMQGLVPGEQYTKARSYKYPTQKDGKMHPMKSVLAAIGVNKAFKPVYSGISAPSRDLTPLNDNMIVISMGGNDVQDKIRSILFGVESFIQAVVTQEFTRNFKKVLDIAKTNCGKIVLISIYLPYLGNGSSYGMYSPFATKVMERWHKFIHGIAKEYNIPVLDLSRTLNVGDRTHYGTEDTRLSNVSSHCIAACLSHIHSHYTGYKTVFAPNCDISKITIE